MKSVEVVRCRGCNSRFRYYNNPGGEMPACPVCAAKHEEVNRLDLTSNRAPSIGGSPMDQAVKVVQEVAERDYGLTNFKSKTDPGEMSVPNLTPTQQMMDSAWKKAGSFTAQERFPGLAPGQGWMDAARAATSATGRASADTISKVTRGLRDHPIVSRIRDEHGRERMRKI